MEWALVLSTALMGLAGTPHCLAMCGASCTALTAGGGAASVWSFHLGRLISYALAGAVVAASVGALAALGQAVSVLRPLWTLLHASALALGLWLLWTGRQPSWMERLGRSRVGVTANVAPGWQRMIGPGRTAAAGLAWAAWPCGLLQSALLVAALANGPSGGALAMAAFAVASSTGLIAGRMAWRRASGDGSVSQAGAAWMVRLAGAALAGASAWALGHGVWMRVADWCAT